MSSIPDGRLSQDNMMNSASTATADRMRDVVERQDETAFLWLVERYLPVVLGAAMRRCNGDRMLAQDVTQDVFIRFAQRLPRLRPDERIGAWLHRAATFRAGDVMRSEQRRRRREKVAAERLALDQLPEADCWEQLAPELDAALASLRANDRELIVQHYFEGQSVDRLATMQSLKAATLRKRLQRALSRLRQRLLDKQLVVTTTSLVAVLTSQLSSEAATLPVGFAEAITAEAISATSASPALPMLAFPFLRDLGLGVIGAFAIGATVALLLPQETGKAEASSPSFSLPLSREKALAKVPQFTYATKQRAPETLEDIMAAIGELLAKPMSSLDRQRAVSLAQRIPEDQAGLALSLIDTTWSEAMTLRLVDYQFGAELHHQPNRHTLFTQWAAYDPESALTWVLLHVGNSSYSWSDEIESALESWSNEDLSTALRWVEQHIMGNAQEVFTGLARLVAKGIGSAIYRRDGAIAATKFMIRLEANWMRSGFDQSIFDPFESFQKSQDFTQAMKVVDGMKSPGKKQSVRFRALRYWRKVDWDSAFHWLQQIPITGYHPNLAWTLGFPGTLPAGYTYETYAEWVEALPKSADSENSGAFYPVINQWLPKDPLSASEWLFAKGYVNQGNVDSLLGQLPRSQEHADTTEEIIAKAIQHFPESVEDYVRETMGVFLHPALKKLKEAQP